jgi:hypothetical protein
MIWITFGGSGPAFTDMMGPDVALVITVLAGVGRIVSTSAGTAYWAAIFLIILRMFPLYLDLAPKALAISAPMFVVGVLAAEAVPAPVVCAEALGVDVVAVVDAVAAAVAAVVTTLVVGV